MVREYSLTRERARCLDRRANPRGLAASGNLCECGADLADAADLGVARSFQQTEIPGPSAQPIQHDLHVAVCGCGREHVALRPPGVPDAAVPIGPRVRALAVYLVVRQHVPVERCRDLIADVTGAEVSAGPGRSA